MVRPFHKGFIELTFKLKHEQDQIFVPFLVTTEEISLPLVGYNVIELCVKTGKTSPELAFVFPSLTRDNVNSLLDIIDTSDDSDFCTVRTNKQQCLIKLGRCSQISCRINHGPIASEIPVIFEPEENPDLPNGLVVSESLFSLKPGKTSVLKSQVHNITKHDIVLPKRTVLGRIQSVQSVTSLDLKLKEDVVNSEPIGSVSANGEIDIDEDIPSHVK